MPWSFEFICISGAVHLWSRYSAMINRSPAFSSLWSLIQHPPPAEGMRKRLLPILFSEGSPPDVSSTLTPLDQPSPLTGAGTSHLRCPRGCETTWRRWDYSGHLYGNTFLCCLHCNIICISYQAQILVQLPPRTKVNHGWAPACSII